MRVLVEQTAAMARSFLESAELDGYGDDCPSVHRLLGGVDLDDWHLHPERPAVLVGTQDMLLSRALNRGYGIGRARWPVEYGLLNQDCLWVMDEVQLMDVGLATSVQLQAFRRAAFTSCRPTRTWWMSATLQPEWLETVDSAPWLPDVRDELKRAMPGDNPGPEWRSRKPAETISAPASDDRRAERFAEIVVDAHDAATPSEGQGRVTLAIVNRVDTAIDLYDAVGRLLDGRTPTPDLRLVHSRFRGLERRSWSSEFLSREACEAAATDRIIIATQVVEAGVDISATALVTELAPWPSLVQRFGRAARYGGEALIRVVDRDVDGKDALPYSDLELGAALKAFDHFAEVGLLDLEEFESDLEGNDPDLLQRLYPYEPLHLLTSRENSELFDTTPDLTGADLDISRFIRTGDDRDLAVCWVPGTEIQFEENGVPSAEVQPLRDGLCPVPVAKARKWLFRKGRRRDGCRAWSWDYVDGAWKWLRIEDCYPGQIVLVDADWGGYHLERGFTGARRRKSEAPPPTDEAYVAGAQAAQDDHADRSQLRDDVSRRDDWKTIVTHCRECANEVVEIANRLGLSDDLIRLLELAARLHDLGKAHPAFQASIGDALERPRPSRPDLAKAPAEAWDSLSRLYCSSEEHGPRKGFRHEFASALALFEILRLETARHPALLGPHRELIEIGVLDPPTEETPSGESSPLGQELAGLERGEFDLLCHLVSAHHGKARGSWQSTPHDQKFDGRRATIGSGQPLHGVREGDILLPIEVPRADGGTAATPSLTLHLDPAHVGLSDRYGSSWSERLARLLRNHGPFGLGYLEAVLRAADIRSSRRTNPDPLIPEQPVTA